LKGLQSAESPSSELNSATALIDDSTPFSDGQILGLRPEFCIIADKINDCGPTGLNNLISRLSPRLVTHFASAARASPQVVREAVDPVAAKVRLTRMLEEIPEIGFPQPENLRTRY
jgi:hypothetical protein